MEPTRLVCEKRLKVCHIVGTLDVGGMENGVVNLCNGYDRTFFEPMICCLKRTGSMVQRLRPDVKVVCMEFSEGKDLLRPLILARLFKQERPDIVHTHGWGGGAWDGVIGARLAKCAVVINGEHGLLFKKWHQILLQRILVRLCDNIFAVSHALKKKVVDTIQINPSYIKVITNGVDVDKFCKNNILQNDFNIIDVDLPKDTLLICSIGSLKPEKNQMMVVKAVQHLLNNGFEFDLKLLLVGDGPQRLLIENYVARVGLEGKVLLLGNRNDIPQILANTDIFVSTSKEQHEGLSNVVLEAMACGIPVVATKSIGIQEIIFDGKTGFLIDSDDIGSLSKKIRLLIDDKEAAMNIGNNGRDLVQSKYSLNRMIYDYENEYIRLYISNTK